MLHIAGIIIAFFLAVLLFTKRGKGAADIILALWLVVIGLHLSVYYVRTAELYAQFPHLLGLEIPMPLLHGPFLYLYVTALVNPSGRKRFAVLHFLPAAVGYLLLAGFFAQPAAHKIYVYQHQGLGYERLTAIICAPIIPSGIVYVLLSLLQLRKHRARIPERYSYTENIQLNWLVYLTMGIGAIWLSVIFVNDTATFLLVDAFVLFIGYFGIRQVGVFTNPVAAEIPEGRDVPETGGVEAVEEKPKYQKNALGPEHMAQIHLALTQRMASEQLYKDPELNLDGLAARLGVSGNALSQVINSIEQRNFYDYVNEYRVREFQRIAVLPENRQFTLLSMAFEVGFNSKTSFNRNFKKATGLSPTAYFQQAKIQPGGA